MSQKIPPEFSDIFPQTVGIFNAIFTHLLYVSIYARLQIFIQLSPTLTKLCHTKRDHPSNFFTSRRHGRTDMRTDGRDAILNAAPRDGRLINRSPVIVSRDIHSLHYSAYHSKICINDTSCFYDYCRGLRKLPIAYC